MYKNPCVKIHQYCVCSCASVKGFRGCKEQTIQSKGFRMQQKTIYSCTKTKAIKNITSIKLYKNSYFINL